MVHESTIIILPVTNEHFRPTTEQTSAKNKMVNIYESKIMTKGSFIWVKLQKLSIKHEPNKIHYILFEYKNKFWPTL